MTHETSSALLTARIGAVRARILTADVLVVVWCLVWWRVATALRDGVAALAGPGAQAVAAGERFSGTLGSAGGAAARVPLVGDSLASPLRGAAGAGTDLADAGRSYQEGVGTVAHGVFWLVLAVAVGLVLARYLLWRVGRVRTVLAARRLRSSPDGLALLGLRTAAGAPLPRLARLTAGAAPGDRVVLDEVLLRRLGEAELVRLGLSPRGR
ncbi:hypothetical protein GCM10027047_04640 [Rhodococcus aerolatus]